MENQGTENEKTTLSVLTDLKASASKLSKKWIVIAVIALTLVIVLSTCLSKCREETPEISTVSVESKSSLEKVLEISELSTVNFTYNAIVRIADEKDPDKMKYYVAYEGNVLAGIDFSAINIITDEENKKITVVLPEVTIQEVNVDIGSLEYIFIDEDAETETVLQEAYKFCLNDLEKRAEKEAEIRKMARTNAISAVSALIKSWAVANGENFQLEVR